MKTYKDLDAWKNAKQLVKEIYSLSSKFPKEEKYALTNNGQRTTFYDANNRRNTKKSS